MNSLGSSFGPYTSYIFASYGFAAVVLGGMVTLVVNRYVVIRRALHRFEQEPDT
jgi:heme exporter protein CcmD